MERRTEGRHPIKIELTLLAGSTEVQGSATDISSRGLHFQCGNFLTPGTQITLTLHGSEQLELMGEVIWCQFHPERVVDAYRIGIQSQILQFRGKRATGMAQKEKTVQDFLAARQSTEAAEP